MNNQFYQLLLQGYQLDWAWKHVNNTLQVNEQHRVDAIELPFYQERSLIYFTNSDSVKKLCILSNLVKEVIALAHDKLGHLGYH